MGYTMRALSQSSEFILSTAEVFVTEPLADWDRRKGKKSVPLDKDTRRQIEIVEEKLNGVNPIHILTGMLKTQNWAKVRDSRF